jgi:hypothetical protein
MVRSTLRRANKSRKTCLEAFLGIGMDALNIRLKLLNGRLSKKSKYNAIWIGEKTTSGKGTGQYGIIFSVDKKNKRLAKSKRTPKSIKLSDKNSQRPQTALVADVIEERLTLRPLGSAGGQSMLAFDSEFGTISFTYEKNGEKLALTCAHVATNVSTNVAGNFAFKNYSNNEFILAGQSSNPVLIASFLSNSVVIDEDIAVLHISSMFAISPYRIFNEDMRITHYGSPTDAVEAIYYYNSDMIRVSCRFDRILAINSQDGTSPNVVLDGRNYTVSYLIRMVCIDGSQSHPGHSGSLLYRRTAAGLIAAGIVFAHGSNNDVWVFPMDRMISRIPAQFRP